MQRGGPLLAHLCGSISLERGVKRQVLRETIDFLFESVQAAPETGAFFVR